MLMKVYLRLLSMVKMVFFPRIRINTRKAFLVEKVKYCVLISKLGINCCVVAPNSVSATWFIIRITLSIIQVSSHKLTKYVDYILYASRTRDRAIKENLVESGPCKTSRREVVNIRSTRDRPLERNLVDCDKLCQHVIIFMFLVKCTIICLYAQLYVMCMFQNAYHVY